MLGTESQQEIFFSLFRQGTVLTYKKGEYIIRPGEAPEYVYLIESGLVKAYNISKYGEENLLIIRKSQEIFPLIWAVTGQGRSIIYQTVAPTVVYRIRRNTFTDFLAKNTEALYPFIDLVIKQYKFHSERILNLEYRTVRERLASFLLTMGTRFGREEGDIVIIDVPLRQQDIASSINASRETTSREVGVLERKGLIDSSQGFIKILNKQALQKLL